MIILCYCRNLSITAVRKEINKQMLSIRWYSNGQRINVGFFLPNFKIKILFTSIYLTAKFIIFTIFPHVDLFSPPLANIMCKSEDLSAHIYWVLWIVWLVCSPTLPLHSQCSWMSYSIFCHLPPLSQLIGPGICILSSLG